MTIAPSDRDASGLTRTPRLVVAKERGGISAESGTSLLPSEPCDGPRLVEEEQEPESSIHRVAPSVALRVSEPQLRNFLSTIIQGAGYFPGGDDMLPVAAVIVTDAAAGAKTAVGQLRALARSDAALIVVLDRDAAQREADAAYEAGAVLCLHTPVDDKALTAAVRSAIDLQSARTDADALRRQLDLHAHLAALGRVTAGFAHEVGNPIAVLLSNLEAVRDDVRSMLETWAPLPGDTRKGGSIATVSPNDLRAALDDMASAVHRIHRLLQAVREVSPPEHGARLALVDLESVARDALRRAAPEMEGIEAQVLVDEPVQVQSDALRLSQIIVNLLTNAAHAAKQLPAPRVRLHVYRSGDDAIVSVRDNGPGVPPELRDKIFEPFFTTRRGQGGTGLGLALCREYASQIRARLTLWTAPGRGSCFRVHLRPASEER